MSTSIARLKRRAEFLRVAATRRKWVAPGLILQVRRHRPGEDGATEAPSIRVGFTASRKVGNAVARNRARRRLRAAVDQIMPAHARAGHDFVVIGRGATLKRPYAALVGDLRKALERLDAFRSDDTDKKGEKP